MADVLAIPVWRADKQAPKFKVYVTPVWEQAGLAVHRAVYATDRGWAITHARSGFGVLRNVRTKRLAIQVARRLTRAGDWTRPRAKIRHDQTLKSAVARVWFDLVRAKS